MPNILDEIIEYKHTEVAAHKADTPVEKHKDTISALPKCRNFYRAVTKANPRGINVIAEVKKASPSAGLIRPDFDPVEIAIIYQQCGADAISVLTDEKYFQGDLSYIARIKESVDLPVLRKDFFVDPYQIYQARAAGADAILLIAEALSPADLMDMLILASQLTLTAIVEVHQLDLLL
ncbi:MAG: indole-3-glycerol-phosphate synthase, partial [Anaerohalosphaera sp.]|nr:indole-3-glycerol-phosphate synthase [Anaerohalosphaera sp.]